MIKKEPKRRRFSPKRLLGMLIALGVLCELLLMLVVFIVGFVAQHTAPVGADAAIVLGARIYPDGQMSPVLWERVQRALTLYEQGYCQYLIVCGGQGKDEPRTEASAMKAFLVESGVPEAHVFMDETSTSTEENLGNARSLMQQSGLRDAILVTSDYHLTRALWQARDAGLTVTGAAAPGPDTPGKFVEAYFRESVSWLNYWSGGFIKQLAFWRG